MYEHELSAPSASDVLVHIFIAFYALFVPISNFWTVTTSTTTMSTTPVGVSQLLTVFVLFCNRSARSELSIFGVWVRVWHMRCVRQCKIRIQKPTHPAAAGRTSFGMRRQCSGAWNGLVGRQWVLCVCSQLAMLFLSWHSFLDKPGFMNRSTKYAL